MLHFLLLLIALQDQTPALTPEVAATVEKGNEALRAGDYAEAIEIFGALRQSLPEHPGPRLNLGLALYLSGNPSEAIQHLKGIAGFPGLEMAWLFLGSSYLQSGQPTRAVKPLEKYVAARPDDPEGRRTLADALAGQERAAEAVVQFRKLSELSPRDPRAWHGLGRAYESLARESFEKLDKAAPESAFWLVLVAESRMTQRQFQGAFFLYRQALNKMANLRGVHIAISHIYKETGHSDWAAAEERKEIELGEPDCEREKFVCEFLGGRYLDLIASQEPTPESYYWLSRTYNQLALASFSKLAQLPPSPLLHEVRAEIHRNQGRELEAVKEWKRVLELAPNNTPAKRELALSLVQSRNYDEARPLVDGLLANDSASPLLNFLAGEIRLNSQQAEKGIPFLRRAAEIAPDMNPARASLGRAYVITGRTEEAIPHLQAALPNDRDGSVHFQLARAYQSTGKPELASQALRTYQEIQKTIQRERALAQEETQITPP